MTQSSSKPPLDDIPPGRSGLDDSSLLPRGKQAVQSSGPASAEFDPRDGESSITRPLMRMLAELTSMGDHVIDFRVAVMVEFVIVDGGLGQRDV